MTKTAKVAKIIRVISAPPLMALCLILLLKESNTHIFTDITDVIFSIIFLSVVPVSGYLIQKMIPDLNRTGRDGQRKIAFLFNLVSYTAAFLYGIIKNVNEKQMLIYGVYFLSVVFLTVINKGMHIKASGHASAITGPIILLIYFNGIKWLFPCGFIYGIINWASLTLKRHSRREIAIGTASCVAAFIVSWFGIDYF